MLQLILSGRICGWFAAVTSATRGASLFRLPSVASAAHSSHLKICDEMLHCFEWSHWISICQCVVSTIWIFLDLSIQLLLQDCPTHGRSWKCGIVVACRSLEQEATSFCTAFLTPSLRHWPKMVWKRVVSRHLCCDLDFWKGVCHFQPKIPIPNV